MSCRVASLPLDNRFDLPPEEVIFGGSDVMRLVRRQVQNAASVNVPVLITGQSGTGKEVVAKLIHERSTCLGGSFVKVNCPAIPESLLESELFGYERGAFTGAYASKPGRVETAQGGTLFLDEIGELQPAMQAKLLQLLQDGRFYRIGDQKERRVEVRVVCATNRDLSAEVQAGKFRRDLFYRINVLPISLPPLSERRRDISMLGRYLTAKYAGLYARTAPPLSKRALQMLETRAWPGNIRELENVIKRFVISGSSDMLVPSDDDLLNGHRCVSGPDEQSETAKDGSLKAILRHARRELERTVILRTLDACGWNRRTAARRLGISYTALLYKMRDAGIGSSRGSQHLGVLASSRTREP